MQTSFPFSVDFSFLTIVKSTLKTVIVEISAFDNVPHSLRVKSQKWWNFGVKDQLILLPAVSDTPLSPQPRQHWIIPGSFVFKHHCRKKAFYYCLSLCTYCVYRGICDFSIVNCVFVSFSLLGQPNFLLELKDIITYGKYIVLCTFFLSFCL